MASDLNAILPASLVITYPKRVDGIISSDPYTVTVTLSNFNLLSSLPVGFSGSRVIHCSTIAVYVEGSLTNSAELSALASQIATDWYSFQLHGADITLVGVQNWLPEGSTECIEWVDDGEVIHTRAVRTPYLEHRDMIQVQGTGGSLYGDIPYQTIKRPDPDQPFVGLTQEFIDSANIPLPIFYALFTARLDDKTQVDDIWTYEWTEMVREEDGPGYIELVDGRSGTLEDRPAYEINNKELTTVADDTVGTLVWMRARGVIDGTGLVYEFEQGSDTSTFFGRITERFDSLSVSIPRRYAFVEVIQDPESPEDFIDKEGGIENDLEDSPLYELNGYYIPVGKIVSIWRGIDDTYLCEYPEEVILGSLSPSGGPVCSFEEVVSDPDEPGNLVPRIGGLAGDAREVNGMILVKGAIAEIWRGAGEDQYFFEYTPQDAKDTTITYNNVDWTIEDTEIEVTNTTINGINVDVTTDIDSTWVFNGSVTFNNGVNWPSNPAIDPANLVWISLVTNICPIYEEDDSIDLVDPVLSGYFVAGPVPGNPDPAAAIPTARRIEPPDLPGSTKWLISTQYE